MTEGSVHADRWGARRVEAIAALLAIVGPTAMVMSGYGDGAWQVATLGVAASLGVGRFGLRRPAGAAIALGCGALVTIAHGPTAAGWLLLGLGLTDWVIRGRPPLDRVGAGHSGTAIAVATLILIAASRTPTWLVHHQPVATASGAAVAAAMAMLACGPDRRRPAAAVTAAATAMALVVGAGHPALVVRVGPTLATAVALTLATTWSSVRTAENGLRLGPTPNQVWATALALPAIAWSAAHFSLMVKGYRDGSPLGFSGWAATHDSRPSELVDLLGYATPPALLCGLLVSGTVLTINGARGLVSIVTAAFGTASAAAAAAMWGPG